MRGILTFLGGLVVGILAVTGVNAVTEENRRYPCDHPEEALDDMEDVGEDEGKEDHDHDDRGGLIIR
jgi:hypothetical protein